MTAHSSPTASVPQHYRFTPEIEFQHQLQTEVGQREVICEQLGGRGDLWRKLLLQRVLGFFLRYEVLPLTFPESLWRRSSAALWCSCKGMQGSFLCLVIFHVIREGISGHHGLLPVPSQLLFSFHLKEWRVHEPECLKHIALGKSKYLSSTVGFSSLRKPHGAFAQKWGTAFPAFRSLRNSARTGPGLKSLKGSCSSKPSLQPPGARTRVQLGLFYSARPLSASWGQQSLCSSHLLRLRGAASSLSPLVNKLLS